MEQLPIVTIEEKDGEILVSCDTTFVFGSGPHYIEAMKDFAEAYLEWYEESTDAPDPA